ncbi:predicted protein [Verticillium alfalfae VaMs.102]|uniref:Predicted protein n=1 Tax=Verticillium alfalfae (strain VaMs.102 / ATCC MYA-4576 / FGSC 10136) TaxID=526221 RepID=C9SR91_VERA1|nr:predicted protein [Verticillium alfalfae VaMs.102]EEY20893.1 predicted protein [Verticillium alfalfae VaMs.102]
MSHKPKDALDQLQYMLNDVIIQIGKALKASTKQPNRQNVSQIHASLQTHESERGFAKRFGPSSTTPRATARRGNQGFACAHDRITSLGRPGCCQP